MSDNDTPYQDDPDLATNTYDVNGLPSYHTMSKRDYLRVNMARFVIEIIGTFLITVFYLMVGD